MARNPAPFDAEFYIVKNSFGNRGEGSDWSEDGIEEEDMVFFKQVPELHRWHPRKHKWEKLNSTMEDMAWEDEDHKTRDVISADTMAQVAVKVAQVLRDYGIECRYNEDLNYLQMSLVDGFLGEWGDQPACYQSGAYEYWEAVHKKSGITRPHG